MTARKPYVAPDALCSIERSLAVVGERWSLLILRQAHSGTTRFADFQSALGLSPQVLTARLTTLVAAGVLEPREYRVAGARTRVDYHLTVAGRELRLVLGALQQWGDDHLRSPGDPPAYGRRRVADERPVRVAFVAEDGRTAAVDEVSIAADPDRTFVKGLR
ncbi:winged helix-turn-helix transcriptional regulator [Paractinoplanes toevensis]|uniref:HxlR family transcriptional regulator n=1 Tax=Paractinoplanes toevensis TaxID=571911 RepID=A0A919W3P3_9ACTN|nr:helix-turn-helix domain-containing protein [Actinoplanes toevensis]GIM93004.1 HxlR family transcriptional regulator [Actinoplanes toevensis]